ncbi:hypothetical protein Rctr85_070 [Virus Rctr85]|nr:hypothetical protein Rctr85_070 [Virus Rctr85]
MSSDVKTPIEIVQEAIDGCQHLIVLGWQHANPQLVDPDGVYAVAPAQTSTGSSLAVSVWSEGRFIERVPLHTALALGMQAALKLLNVAYVALDTSGSYLGRVLDPDDPFADEEIVFAAESIDEGLRPIAVALGRRYMPIIPPDETEDEVSDDPAIDTFLEDCLFVGLDDSARKILRRVPIQIIRDAVESFSHATDSAHIRAEAQILLADWAHDYVGNDDNEADESFTLSDVVGRQIRTLMRFYPDSGDIEVGEIGVVTRAYTSIDRVGEVAAIIPTYEITFPNRRYIPALLVTGLGVSFEWVEENNQ